MNSAPRDDLQVEDVRITPELVRQLEANALAGGRRRLQLLAVAPNGDLAGLTDLGWRPGRASLVGQGNTGVLPEHRGLGLGKWLKAAMLEALLGRNPEARFVRTGNADSNAPMLAINRALGFTPHSAETVWQVPTERVRAYLEGPASGPAKG